LENPSLVVQYFLELSRLMEPVHHRYCWVRKASASAGHSPVARGTGTYRSFQPWRARSKPVWTSSECSMRAVPPMSSRALRR